MATDQSVVTRADGEEHPAVRALENAPLAGPEDFSREEIAHLESLALAAPVAGPGQSTPAVLEALAERTKHGHE